MSRKHCRFPNLLDRQVANLFCTSPKIIANLRGMYEVETKQKLESVEDYKTKLVAFKNELQQRDNEKLEKILNCSRTQTFANALDLMRNHFTSSEIQELEAHIAGVFTELVNAHVNEDPVIQQWIADRKSQGLDTKRSDVIKRIGFNENDPSSNRNRIISELYWYMCRESADNDLMDRVRQTKGAMETLIYLSFKNIANNEGVKFGDKIAYSVKFTNNETLEADFTVEDDIKEGWMRELDKESPVSRLGEEVRSFFSRQIVFEPKMQEVDGVMQPIPVRSKNGFITYHNGSEVHKRISSIIAGVTNVKDMMRRIERAGESDVNIKNIADALLQDPVLQDMVFRDMHSTHTEYTKCREVRFGKNKGLFFDRILPFSASYTAGKHIRALRKQNLSETIFKTDDKGNILVHGDRWLQFKSFMQSNVALKDKEIFNDIMFLIPDAEVTDKNYDKNFNEVRSIVKSINAFLGIQLSNEQIDNLISNKVALKTYVGHALYIANKETRIEAGTPFVGSGSSRTLRDRIQFMVRTAREASNDSSKSIRINKSTYFTDIVGCKFATTIDHIRTFAMDAREALVEDDVEKRDVELKRIADELHEYLENEYGQSSEYYLNVEDGTNAKGEPVYRKIFYNEWIKLLYETTEETLRDPSSFIYRFTYDRAMALNDVAAEDFSEEYDLKTFLANYNSYTTDAQSGYARYPVFTTGDSLALKFITAKKYSLKTLIPLFRLVARQEIARMQLEKNIKDSEKFKNIDLRKTVTLANKTDEECSGTFKYLEFLNNDEYKTQIREAMTKGTAELNKVLEDIIRKELFEEYKRDFYDKVKDREMFRVDPDNPKVYSLMPNIILDPETVENEPIDDVTDNMLYLYYINTKYAYIQQFQFLKANPAPFGLSTAMQKRYKAYNAPGSSMNIYVTDSKGKFFIRTKEEVGADGKTRTVFLPERCLYFKDNIINAEESDPEFMKALATKWSTDDPRYKKYRENDATDGQGWRTFTSYRRVMGMAMQWRNIQGAEEFYNKYLDLQKRARLRTAKELLGREIKSLDELSEEEKLKVYRNTEFTREEFEEYDKASVVLQCIKPHTCTSEKLTTDSGDVLYIPVEHKYAENILIPELLPTGSFRKDLAIEMEIKDLDLACSEQCVKVGSFGAADFRSSSSETLSNDAKQGYIHEIPYEDYTIQTNIPEHINALQLFGTQLRKHTFNAIDLIHAFQYINGTKEVTINGKKLRLDGENGGKNFIKFYNALICENMGSDLSKLAMKIADASKLSDILSALKGNDSNASIEDLTRYALNDEETEFTNPLCDPATSFDTESSLTSLFKKNVNKQHINGGSCVQVSDFGLSGYGSKGSPLHVQTDDKDNITYVEIAMSFDFSFTDASGMKVDLDYADYVDWKTGKPLGLDGKPLPEGVEPALPDAEHAEYGWNTKLGRDFPGIYDLVLYRIPTEREYSIINGRVKRFYHKSMGGIVSVPSEFTTIAGFDFDIDKLYYFRKEFRAKTQTKSTRAKTWAKIYGLNQDEKKNLINGNEIYDALKAAKKKAIENYKSTLADDQSIQDEVVASSTGSHTNTFADLAPELANLFKEDAKGEEAVESNEEEEKESTDINPENKKLFEFWNEAGLVEKTGKTASQYFSQYVAEHRNEDIEFEEYDYSKNAEDNTVTARNNELIKCIQSKLVSDATFNSRYTPGGFTKAKHDANILKVILYMDSLSTESIQKVLGKDKITNIEEAERFVEICEERSKDKNEAIAKEYTEILDALDPDRDVTNVLTTATYNARNRVAAKVIGIMANHNTNAVYSKTMNIFKLREAVQIMGHTAANLNGSDINDASGNAVDYMLTLAEFLAASVDAVKTPVLNFLNVNVYTANAAALMARLGFNTEEIGLFLSQPIIKEVCDYASNNNCTIATAMKKVADKYNIKDALSSTYKTTDVSKEVLFVGLRSEIIQKDGRAANVLAQFRSINEKAQALSDFIGKTKYTAANSIENSIGGLIATIYENEAVNTGRSPIAEHLIMSFAGFDSQAALEADNKKQVSSPIRSKSVTLKVLKEEYGLDVPDLTLDVMNTEEYKKSLEGTPFAFEQMVHDAIVAYIEKLSAYFPYSTGIYSLAYKTIYNNVLYGDIDKDTIDAINRQFPVYILQHISDVGTLFSPDKNEIGDGKSRDYYTVDFPKQLIECLEDREQLKNIEDKEEFYKKMQSKYEFLSNTDMDSFIDNELLDNLDIDEYAVTPEDESDESAIRSRYSISLRDNSQFDKDTKNITIAAWERLILDQSKNITDARKSLAHALFMYNFFTRGYEVGNNAFINIVPQIVRETLIVREGLNYNQFYNGLIEEGFSSQVDMNEFMRMFYSNNSDNRKIVMHLRGQISETGFSENKSTKIKFQFKQENYKTYAVAEANKDNADLFLSNPKRNCTKDEVFVTPVIKLIDNDGTERLFVLTTKTSMGTEAGNITSERFNVRKLNSQLWYEEIPVRGVKYRSVDYTERGSEDSSWSDESWDNYNEDTDNHMDYNNDVPADESDAAKIDAEAQRLEEQGKNNTKLNGGCL